LIDRRLSSLDAVETLDGTEKQAKLRLDHLAVFLFGTWFRDRQFQFALGVLGMTGAMACFAERTEQIDLRIWESFVK
jgi:hypothetical protein